MVMMNRSGCAGDFADDDYQCCGSAPALGAFVLRGMPRNRGHGGIDLGNQGIQLVRDSFEFGGKATQIASWLAFLKCVESNHRFKMISRIKNLHSTTTL